VWLLVVELRCQVVVSSSSLAPPCEVSSLPLSACLGVCASVAGQPAVGGRRGCVGMRENESISMVQGKQRCTTYLKQPRKPPTDSLNAPQVAVTVKGILILPQLDQYRDPELGRKLPEVL
jgi:hypothetical protein